MEEILQSPEFQKMMPYLIAASIFQLVLWLLLANVIRRTLLLVRKENRCMIPGQAWLLAVPLLNIYWNFVVLRKLTDSLNNEFHDLKIAVDEDPTQNQGYFYAGAFLASNFPLPTFINYIVSVLVFVSLISYGLKVNEYRKILKESLLDNRDEN